MTTVGEKTVTVTYEGQTASFTINVVAKPEYNYTFSIVAPEVTEIANGESVEVIADGADEEAAIASIENFLGGVQ